jgi:hypothetical protein
MGNVTLKADTLKTPKAGQTHPFPLRQPPTEHSPAKQMPARYMKSFSH